MTRLVLALSLILVGHGVQALERNSQACGEYLNVIENTQVTRQFFGSSCWLSIQHDNQKYDLIYRNYLITDDGMLMVFNSYGPGPESQKTGARIFHFFPRERIPHAELINGELHLHLAATATTLIMNPKSGQLTTLTGGTVTEDPKVNDLNQGGVEITKSPTLYLDSGFKKGSDARTNPKDFSTFIDSKQNSCRIRNDEFFLYKSGDIVMRYETDQDIFSFVAKRCPQLAL